MPASPLLGHKYRPVDVEDVGRQVAHDRRERADDAVAEQRSTDGVVAEDSPVVNEGHLQGGD